jgi:hypothetical protein
VDQLTSDPAAARATLSDVFLPDAVGHYGPPPIHGLDALVTFLCDAIAGNSEWRVHMIHTPLIQVDGDTATGAWTLMVHLKRPDGPVDILLGRYSDEFIRTPDGWRIASVRFLRQG